MRDKVKRLVRKIAPQSLMEKVDYLRRSHELTEWVKLDRLRFLQYAAIDEKHLSHANVRSKLMYYSHQVEKGLSHQDFRYGFGANAIKQLGIALAEFRTFPNYQDDDFYQNAIGALREYAKKHSSKSSNIPHFEFLTPEVKEELKTSRALAGSQVIHSIEKENNKQINFKNLAEHRSSIRDFKQSTHIPVEKMNEVFEIAMKTPSVCNRQASRVTVIKDVTLMKTILDLQGGFRGYGQPDCVLAITNDVSYYLRPQERNQGQIDGGLYAMSILYGLEFESIGACPLSANIAKDRLSRIRELLNTPDNENFIMFIACGIMQDEVKSPISYRSSFLSTVRTI